MVTFSLCYTSRRHSMIKPIVDQWRAKAVVPTGIEIIVCIDANDPESQRLMNNEGKSFGVKWVVQDQAPFNCVRGWNRAAEFATGKVIIAISDDFIPPAQWDHRLLTLAPNDWIEGEWVVRINDGFVRDICTMPIMTRRRYDRFGYIFYPRYESMFCDTDLTERAKQDGVLLDAMHIVFEHHHPNIRKRTMDSVDLTHASSERWHRGELLFNFRKQRGFPIDDGPKACQFIVLGTEAAEVGKKYAVYIQATKDDFCLLDVCARSMQEGCSNFFFCIPDEYWSGKPTPHEDIEQVRAIAAELTTRGANVHERIFNVASYRAPGRSRIEVETYLRNDSLKWIQESGYAHILIMDGDELWVPGLLHRINEEVERSHPPSVTCKMVPVVGLPGYPINNAKDTITVYIRADVRFYNCRSPSGHSTLMDYYGVIHFTACRRTMEEIIEKHRQSGHYDDPDYDMEGWIQNTLPKVRPGLKNVHMFKKWQIWPEARNWTVEEINYIPESLHQYLGIDHQVSTRIVIPSNVATTFSDQLVRPYIPKACHFSSSPNTVRKGMATRHP